MIRRRMMGMESEEMGLKYATGEFTGTGSGSIMIEHGLGVVPFLFAFIAEPENETSGTLSGIFMNTELVSYYTTSVTKQFMETGSAINSTGDNTVSIIKPVSASYGVQTADETQITIKKYGNNHNFISEKVYKWIAIADWRS